MDFCEDCGAQASGRCILDGRILCRRHGGTGGQVPDGSNPQIDWPVFKDLEPRPGYLLSLRSAFKVWLADERFLCGPHRDEALRKQLSNCFRLLPPSTLPPLSGREPTDSIVTFLDGAKYGYQRGDKSLQVIADAHERNRRCAEAVKVLSGLSAIEFDRALVAHFRTIGTEISVLKTNDRRRRVKAWKVGRRSYLTPHFEWVVELNTDSESSLYSMAAPDVSGKDFIAQQLRMVEAPWYLSWLPDD